MDCSREALLDELSDFERQRPAEIPAILDEYLSQVAKTGDTIFPWHRLKPLLCRKLEMVMNEFYEAFPTDALPVLPNVEAFKYEDMKTKILETLDAFTSAPFTIQRLCELVVDPRKHYRRTDKFMRGVEKNVLVVSTVEPKSASAQQQGPGTPMVNGVPGSEELGINGHSADEGERMRMHAVDPELESHPGKIEAVEAGACLEGASVPYGDGSSAELDDDKDAGGADTSDVIDTVPAVSEESTPLQAEAKEATAVPSGPAESILEKRLGSEVQGDNLEQTAEKDKAKVQSDMVEVSSTGGAEELATAVQDEGKDPSSSDSEAAAAVEENADALQTVAGEQDLNTSGKAEDRPNFDDEEEGPPLKKFHSESHVSVEENADSLGSEASEEDPAHGDAAIDDSLPAEKGSAERIIGRNIEMIEETSDVSSTDSIAAPEALTGEEPMDQD